MSEAPPVLITGASRGLGHALALALAGRYHIVAVARTVGALEELDDAVVAAGGQATLAPMDVTDEGAMAHLCRGIYDRWGALAGWAHTVAHAAPMAPADHVAAKDLATAVSVNVAATSTLIRMVAPLLPATAPALFFDDVHHRGPFFGAYAASKAAQAVLVRAWAEERRRLGPQVHLLAPAPMPTAVRARFFPGEDRAALTRPADEARRLLATAGWPTDDTAPA